MTRPACSFTLRHSFLASALCLGGLAASATAASIVYEAVSTTEHFVADTENWTPERPSGNHVGNTITLEGTDRYLTSVSVKVATSDTSVPDQTVTLKLFQNDGEEDKATGVGRPGTLIASASISGVSFQSSRSMIPLTFELPFVLAPETFTFTLDFSPGSAEKRWVGAVTNKNPASIGSSLDTLWFGFGEEGKWESNAKWAILDGASTNVLDAVFLAEAEPIEVLPEASPMLLVGLGAVWLAASRRAQPAGK